MTSRAVITVEEIEKADDKLRAHAAEVREKLALRVRADHLIPFCRLHGLTYYPGVYGDRFCKHGETDELSYAQMEALEGYWSLKALLGVEVTRWAIADYDNASYMAVTEEDLERCQKLATIQ